MIDVPVIYHISWYYTGGLVVLVDGGVHYSREGIRFGSYRPFNIYDHRELTFCVLSAPSSSRTCFALIKQPQKQVRIVSVTESDSEVAEACQDEYMCSSVHRFHCTWIWKTHITPIVDCCRVRVGPNIASVYGRAAVRHTLLMHLKLVARCTCKAFELRSNFISFGITLSMSDFHFLSHLNLQWWGDIPL